MDAPGWLTQRQADVPPGARWLGKDERRVLARLRTEPRRAAWRLGRWTAKAALGAWLGIPAERVQVLAASDGAPEAWLDGERLPLSISLSHRGGHALAVLADAPQVVGCDIEVIEPRSDAFVREWLEPSEQQLVLGTDLQRRALLVNLIWTAKEAAAKVRREGLRLDLRRAVVAFDENSSAGGGWHGLRVDWDDGTATTEGWWRPEPGLVMAVMATAPSAVPRPLAERRA